MSHDSPYSSLPSPGKARCNARQRNVAKTLFFLLPLALFATPCYALKTLVIINNGNPDAYAPFQLVSVNPYENQVLDATPATITLTFSQGVQPDKSFIRVRDMYGQAVEVGALGADDKRLSVALPELNPGKYSVKWRARCRCDSENELGDNFRFTVR